MVERAVSQYAEGHGYQPGAADAALCAEAAQATAKLMVRQRIGWKIGCLNRGSVGRGGQLTVIFPEQVGNSILPPRALKIHDATINHQGNLGEADDVLVSE